MVRTKQTAKKTTGGSAPCISLNNNTSVLPRTVLPVTRRLSQPAVSELQPKEPRSGEFATRSCLGELFSSGRSVELFDTNNDFCHMCADGGELWKCDVCVRSECKKCVLVPPEHLPLVEHQDVKFLCLSCHLMDDLKTKTVIPYMAFYRDGSPVLPQPPRVQGHFELSPKSFIHAPLTIVIHLRLKSIPAKGPIDMLYTFLRPYFVQADAFVTKDVPFDLGSEGKRRAYLKNATGIAQKLLAMRPSVTIIAISTHTDDDRGDFFAGQEDDKAIAAAIQDFFDVLLEPFKCITQNAILYMLSCGRYVRHSDSRGQFAQTIGRLGFAASITFDAPRFHPSIAWAFLTSLTELVAIQGHTFADAVPAALGKSNGLNQHSGIYAFLLSQDRKIVHMTRYLWAHRDYRPWGKEIPLQCLKCGTPQERWHRTTKHSGYQFKCRNTDCRGDKEQGPYTFDVKKPKRVTILPHGKTPISGWTRKHLHPMPV